LTVPHLLAGLVVNCVGAKRFPCPSSIKENVGGIPEVIPTLLPAADIIKFHCRNFAGISFTEIVESEKAPGGFGLNPCKIATLGLFWGLEFVFGKAAVN
jgi:hypothetical protein